MEHQAGERRLGLAEARANALAAVRSLGLDVRCHPVSSSEPGAWRCVLTSSGGRRASGAGKGDEASAEVGALFEALEHFVAYRMPDPTEVTLRVSREVADELRSPHADPAISVLLDSPAQPLACATYRSLLDAAARHVPIFLSMPDYTCASRSGVRGGLGDEFDYRRAARYAVSTGWAAGTHSVDAVVHAINEIIERDAMSLLLIGQFLAKERPPLRALVPETLPSALLALWRECEDYLQQPVHLLEMTSDLDVPAYWAFVPPVSGEPARLRGSGASLSRARAVTRALTELKQFAVLKRNDPTWRPPEAPAIDHSRLQLCYQADFTGGLPDAVPVPFVDTEPPDKPDGHLRALVTLLGAKGFDPLVWTRKSTGGVAVCHVVVAGLERFMMITDGQVVLPGPRGMEIARTGSSTAES